MRARAARPAPTCSSRRARRGSSSRVGDPDPRTNGARHRAAARGRNRGRDRHRRGRGRAQHGRLPHPSPARPALRHPEARHVDRRQDRAAVGREPLDHRRGGARPRPSRARARRHDPGRPRHLRGRRAAARRAPARARGPLAAPGAADPRRRRSKAGPGSAARRRSEPSTDVNDLLVEGGAGDRHRLPRRRPGRPAAHLPRADPDRRGQVGGRRYRPRAASPTRTAAGGSTDTRPLGIDRLRSLRARSADMFTGIITDIGRIEAVEPRGDLRVRIACGYDMASVDLGASIACSGVCLTVVDKGDELVRGRRLGRDPEPHRRPACGARATRLNLERALKVGDELGGHIVTGHVDGVGEVDGGRAGRRFDPARRSSPAPELAPYVAAKGSIALDGVSLTVNEVRAAADGGVASRVNIIPHTAAQTTFADVARRADGQYRDRHPRPLSRPDAGSSRQQRCDFALRHHIAM